MSTLPIPKLRPPAQARGVSRDATAAPRGTAGVVAAATDCSKLSGPARAICYQAQAVPAPPIIPFPLPASLF